MTQDNETLLTAWLDKSVIWREPTPVTVEEFLRKVSREVVGWYPAYGLEEEEGFGLSVFKMVQFATTLDGLPSPEEGKDEMRRSILERTKAQKILLTAPDAIDTAYNVLDHLLNEGQLEPGSEFVKFMQRGRDYITILASRLRSAAQGEGR